jgi:hypothetical protein
MGSGAFGVDDTLRDTLTVKVRELVDEVEVLEQDRTKLAGGQRVLVVVHRVTYDEVDMYMYEH